jgi:hypothetical protein
MVGAILGDGYTCNLRKAPDPKIEGFRVLQMVNYIKRKIIFSSFAIGHLTRKV